MPHPTRSTAARPPTYGGVAIALHWLIAVAITGTFAVGIYMHDLPLTPHKLQIYSWHKWAGVSIFAFVVLRLLWRLTHRPPPASAGMPAWQRQLAEATHVLLYLLMFAVPLTGWLMSSAKGFQTVYFGVLPIADLIGKNADLGDRLQTVHRVLNLALALLVLGHFIAALKHHLIERDEVLVRMLPFLKTR